jgi:hypothetical protein
MDYTIHETISNRSGYVYAVNTNINGIDTYEGTNTAALASVLVSLPHAIDPADSLRQGGGKMYKLGKQTMQLWLVLAFAISTLVGCGATQTGNGGAGSTAVASNAMPSATLSAPSTASAPTTASTIAPTSAAQSSPVTDQASLIKALQVAGASVTVNGTIQQPFLQVPGTQVTVDGQDVQVFEYRDATTAQADAPKLAEVLAGKGTAMVNWVASPHAYQAGRLIALYIGDDAATLKQLQQVIGSPIAELQRPNIAPSAPSAATPAASPGAESLDAQGLIDTLRAKGLRVTPGDKVIQPFFSIEGRAYKVNDADVQVFEFPDAAGAQASIAKLSPEGSAPNAVIDWVGPPHFYQIGRVIVLYVGEDRTIIDVLTTILGPQRAGQ